MARELSILAAGNATGPRRMAGGDVAGDPEHSVVLRIESSDLKNRPVHEVPLSDDDALLLAEQLLVAVRTRRKILADEQHRADKRLRWPAGS